MSSSPIPGPPPSTLEQVLAEQRVRWEQGERPLVETYLQRQPSLRSDAEAILDLINNEIVLRSEHGEAPRLDEYQARFPALADQLTLLFEVHQALEGEGLAVTLQVLQGTGASTSAPALLDLPAYEVRCVLGSGGMGVVYLALHRPLKRLVALKMIRTGAQPLPEQLGRFRREAEAVARLTHPNIVQVYDVGEHQGQPYLALEYVSGGSLAEQLNRAPQPPRAAAELVKTLAQAIHFAHEHGIVHRDLKPANILLHKELAAENAESAGKRKEKKFLGFSSALSAFSAVSSVPKITDFGLAKLVEGDSLQTHSSAILGTPSYMAPEQAEGRARDTGPLVDVYALGAILYEMLTGRPPFLGATVLATLEQVRSAEPVPPMRLQPGVPRDLDTICLKCLQKEPGKRYRSAADLGEDLDRFLRGAPIRARPVSPVEQVVKWARRHPDVAALLGLIVVGVVVSFGVILGLLRWALQGEDTASRQLYISRINLAQRDWEDVHPRRMRDDLEPYLQRSARQPDLRGFEWYYLWGLLHTERCRCPGQNCVAFSPDGKALATAGPENTVQVWDVAATGLLRAPRWVLHGHTDGVTGVTFSKDGSRLLSGSKDRTLRVWGLSTGKPLRTLHGPNEAVTSVAWSPDGETLGAASRDGTVCLWDAQEGDHPRLILDQHTKAVNCLAFSADSQRVAAGSDDATTILWSVQTGEVLQTLHGHGDAITGLAFRPGENQLATVSWDRALRLWDARTGRQLAELPPAREWISSVAFSPDGKLLATSGWDQTVQVWDSKALLNPIAVGAAAPIILKGHTDRVAQACFCPDSTELASVGKEGVVRVWPLAPQEHTPIHRPQLITSVAITPDGTCLALGSAGGASALWDLGSGQEICPLRTAARIGSVAFDPRGQHLAWADDHGGITYWDATARQPVWSIVGHQGAANAVAFHPGGKRLASGGDDGLIHLWDTAAGQLLASLTSGQRHVNALVYYPDGKRLAAAGSEGSIDVWPLSGSSRGAGQPLLRLTGHQGAVFDLRLSRDGRRLASCGEDQTIRLWSSDKGQREHTLTGHTGTVQGIAFSPDGDRLASASADGTVKFWDVITGQELLTLRGHKREASAVVFRPDGKQLISVGGSTIQGEVRVWDGARGWAALFDDEQR
jgi:WD40 repeat protein/serine/threonine protein kinase